METGTEMKGRKFIDGASLRPIKAITEYRRGRESQGSFCRRTAEGLK